MFRNTHKMTKRFFWYQLCKSKRRYLFYILIVVILVYYLSGLFSSNTPAKLTGNVDKLLYGVCSVPQFALPTSHVYQEKNRKLSCVSGDNEWAIIQNGKLKLNIEKNQIPKVTCVHSIVKRLDDFESTKEPWQPISDGDPIPSDIFYLKCSIPGFLFSKTILLTGIKPVTNVHSEQRTPSSKPFLDANVVVLGFDSVSHNSFVRNLPLSYATFTNKMDGIVFQKHSILGDGTTTNVLAALTGYRETELPDARRDKQNTNTVDNFPWIWKDFKKAGYVTQYAEDHFKYGTFQYRLRGFQDQPTDHYLRPFYQFANLKSGCHGLVPRHMVFFNWLTEFYSVYQDAIQKKFSYIFHAESSHEDNAELHPVDKDLNDLLGQFGPDGIFNNTILILFSDHGARYASMRATIQGKYEERLPFLGIYLPHNVRVRWPFIQNHLRFNSLHLTSHFDVHATLRQILGLSPVPQTHAPLRSLSLWHRVNENRTCHDCAIDAHWCVCLQWIQLPTNDQLVLQASNQIVKTINNHLVQYDKKIPDLCAQLYLNTILSAEYYLPDKALISFRGAKDKDGYHGDFSDKMVVQHTVYRIQLRTSPGDAIFEATAIRNNESGKWKIQLVNISRINKYAKWISCLNIEYPSLRKFCICKNML